MEYKEKLNQCLKELEDTAQTNDFVKFMSVGLIKSLEDKNEIYKVEMSDQSRILLLKSILIGLESYKHKEMTLYDPIVSRNNSIEVVLANRFSNITEIIRQMNNKWLPSTKGLSEIDFQYYLVKIEFNDLKIMAIGTFTSVYRIKKKMLIGNFSEKKLKLNGYDAIIGFNRKIDCIIINDEFIFLNSATSKFDSLFKMDLFYGKSAIQELENNSELKKVFDKTTRERLKPKVRNGKRLARRLIKIVSNKHRLEKTVENIDKLQPFIDDKSHPLHSKVEDIILQKGKITVKEGKESQLLNSISDSFYRAIISGESDIDNTRM